MLQMLSLAIVQVFLLYIATNNDGTNNCGLWRCLCKGGAISKLRLSHIASITRSVAISAKTALQLGNLEYAILARA